MNTKQENIAIPEEKYKHLKTGNCYIVKLIANHTETKEELVIYSDIRENNFYARPKSMFEDGRFINIKNIEFINPYPKYIEFCDEIKEYIIMEDEQVKTTLEALELSYPMLMEVSNNKNYGFDKIIVFFDDEFSKEIITIDLMVDNDESLSFDFADEVSDIIRQKVEEISNNKKIKKPSFLINSWSK